ncbi:hypothetical protein [Pontibacter sp. G13]|uniref:hypothetical protein n=1 Tax=Pontibacter sp. G13 TaxID=3074898 RepID=UPI00288B8827|nr:hypothetical protein [Pontibacter sp. G13]WNJ17132.1 hypothetical protein RJD25_19935 [Pontibacter sp. G13]
MTDRTDVIRNDKLNQFSLHQKVISNLSAELGIPDLRSGKLTIRDEKDWRINEKEIDYCWLVNVSRSFVGWCWLFSLKFNESDFRDKKNPEELIQGIFTISNEGEIDKLFKESRSQDFNDNVKNLTSYDLFDANRGITLDGVGYEYLIFAPNTEIRISLNNPNSENWKTWEREIFSLGVSLAQKSGVTELKEIFE